MDQHLKRERRSVRYTFLLSPTELTLAKELAESESRNVPDFFRAHIYETARSRKMSVDNRLGVSTAIGTSEKNANADN